MADAAPAVIDLTGSDDDGDALELPQSTVLPHVHSGSGLQVGSDSASIANPDALVPFGIQSGSWTAINDEGSPPGDTRPKTLDPLECRDIVVDVFPRISPKYVLNLITQHRVDTAERCQDIVQMILDGPSYPTQKDEINENGKRRRAPSEEYADGRRAHELPGYHTAALETLKLKFPRLPVEYIDDTLHRRDNKTLYLTYLAIQEDLRNYDPATSRFTMLRNRRPPKPLHISEELKQRLTEELDAAVQKYISIESSRRCLEEQKLKEEANLRVAMEQNMMGECPICCEEVPINRMVHCDADTSHLVCRGCAMRCVEEELGKMRCRPKCVAKFGCQGTFSRRQLLSFLSSKSFERLERLQQEEEIREAGLENIAECPFCDYKEEYPAVEVNKEFRCQREECLKVSCRLCQKETHIPKSCQEMEQDARLSKRHKVEEAKSQALIRKCNKCKNPFIKESGCNKMTCSKCGHSQCYACGANTIGDYNHFGHPPKCVLHDNQEERHENDIKRAEAEVIAKIRAEDPEVSEEDLKIKVSERVERAEQARREADALRHAERHPAALPAHLVLQQQQQAHVLRLQRRQQQLHMQHMQHAMDVQNMQHQLMQHVHRQPQAVQVQVQQPPAPPAPNMGYHAHALPFLALPHAPQRPPHAQPGPQFMHFGGGLEDYLNGPVAGPFNLHGFLDLAHPRDVEQDFQNRMRGRGPEERDR